MKDYKNIKKVNIFIISFFLAFIFFLLVHGVAAAAIIIDHTTTDFSQIPDYWIEQVKQNIKMYYGHTSHGTQITSGLTRIESQYGSKYSVAIGSGSLPAEAGAFAMFDASTYDWGPDFYPTVAGVLSSNPQINVVMYMWCGQPSSGNWQTLLNGYIADMQSLEQQYPNVTFVYATGNAQEQDCAGCLRQQFNEQLRQFARNNNKVLFDFGDLDVWYNGVQTTYSCPSWCSVYGCAAGMSLPSESPEWGGGNYNNPCGHALNASCDNKGKAFWWLLARIAGWNGVPSGGDTQAPSVPTGLSATAVSPSQINLSWTASTDNVGVTGYRIYRCTGSGCTPSTQIATSASNSYQNTALVANTTYVYRVAAYDAAGNVSGQSASASATTQAGTTKRGDLNNDGRVDVIDLGIFLSNWGSTSRPPADINQDGHVDVIDLGILLSNWG